MKTINEIGPGILNVGEKGDSFNKLPLGYYTIRHNDNIGLYFAKVDHSPLPDTLYIDTKLPDYWIKSYKERKSNVGILMSGLKGTGKTVTAKYVCENAGLPVVILNPGLNFASQLNYLNQSVIGDFVLFIDEFEKVVNQEKNEIIAPILTFLDGGNVNNVLTVICVNGRVSEFLLGRLGRILFKKDFSGLSKEQIKHIVYDFLREDYKDQADHISEYLMDNLSKITIDNVVNIIKEINIGTFSVEEVLNIVNIERPTICCSFYEVVEGEEIDLFTTRYLEDLSSILNCNINRGPVRKAFCDRILDPETKEHKKYYGDLLKEFKNEQALRNILYDCHFLNNTYLELDDYEEDIEILERTKNYILFKIKMNASIYEHSPFKDITLKVYLKPITFSSKKNTF